MRGRQLFFTLTLHCNDTRHKKNEKCDIDCKNVSKRSQNV